jgi:serine/threonine protein kinase
MLRSQKSTLPAPPVYISPEVAQLMLAKLDRSSSCEVLYAGPAIDVFSLGLSVFEIATGRSFWEYLDVRVHPTVDVLGVLKAAISLTDSSTTVVLEKSLHGEIYRDLRSWLLDA